MIVASPQDYRELAKKRLPHFLFEYIDGGSHTEYTLRKNTEDLSSVELRQRILRDVSGIDLSSQFCGQQLSLPLALGPIGLAGLYAQRGEVQAARAAEKHGVPFSLSTVSVCPLAEVTQAVSKPLWFQLYMIRDRVFMRDLLQQAKAANCSALIFTVDMPVPGTRYRDYRSGLAGASGLVGDINRTLQAAMHPQWAWNVGIHGRPHHLGNVAPVLGDNTGLEDFFAWMRNNFDPSIGWKDLDFIRNEWDGPLFIKGIMDVEDAQEAVKLGADGLVVSNHGGRQLDGAPSSVSALPTIAAAVGEDIEVWADGGIRSGLDVIKMLALGAKGVFLGRAWAYALGGAGQAGVEHMLKLIEAEMRVTMALTGATCIDDINRDILLAANH